MWRLNANEDIRQEKCKKNQKTKTCCGRNRVTCGERNRPDFILNKSTGQTKVSSISPLNTRREPSTSSTWSHWSSKTWQHKNNQTKITWAVLSKKKRKRKEKSCQTLTSSSDSPARNVWHSVTGQVFAWCYSQVGVEEIRSSSSDLEVRNVR